MDELICHGRRERLRWETIKRAYSFNYRSPFKTDGWMHKPLKGKKSNRHGQLRKIQNEEVDVIDSELIFFCGEELCTFAQHEGGKINWKKLM